MRAGGGDRNDGNDDSGDNGCGGAPRRDVVFDSVLIANRGEIAARIRRTVQRLGLRAVMVYSDADRDAAYLRGGDLAVHIGAAPAAASYLRIPALLEAARVSAAQAVHPGYGFLSERAEFAAAVAAAGLVFIGPDAAAIAAMGDKRAARRRMREAGVACIPGEDACAQDDASLLAAAQRLGLPLMIKAAAGGGGRGMRRVDADGAVLPALRTARSEAQAAFGNGDLLLERALVGARHVEVQILGDRQGHCLHLGERDCSVQRRHQKVIEEAPAPGLDEALRERLGAAAVAVARAVHYVGAGTVEFLLAPDGAFYFLEMNTRLQVEHAVTECVYDLDLVEWQLRVAAGQSLPWTQEELRARRRGAAIEVRLCAEDPAADYRPQSGTVWSWRPPQAPGLRVETALADGQTIPPYYDSLQAKLIAYGDDREQARRRLLHAVQQTRLFGVASNRDLLCRLLATPAFAAAELSTAFIAAHLPADAGLRPPQHALLAAWCCYLDDTSRLRDTAAVSPEWLHWQSSAAPPVLLRLADGDRVREIAIAALGDNRFRIGDRARGFGAAGAAGEVIECLYLSDERQPSDTPAQTQGCVRYCCGGVQAQLHWARRGDTVWLDGGGALAAWRDLSRAAPAAPEAGSDGRLYAHSDGRIAAVLVAPGQHVAAQQPLLVLEAMKMEFALSLPVAGRVDAVLVEAAQVVRARQLLLQLD